MPVRQAGRSGGAWASWYICIYNPDNHPSLPLSLNPSLAHTGMRTSSIKARRSLLQLSIRKLSLGFRALAYRHLDEAFSESAVSAGPAICIEFIGKEERWGVGGEGGEGREGFFSLFFSFFWRRNGQTDSKHICVKGGLLRNRWI